MTENNLATRAHEGNRPAEKPALKLVDEILCLADRHSVQARTRSTETVDDAAAEVLAVLAQAMFVTASPFELRVLLAHRVNELVAADVRSKLDEVTS